MRSAEYPAAADGPAPLSATDIGEADTDVPQSDVAAWAPRPATTSLSPCAQPRAEVDSRCAEAERLTAASEFARDELREARRRHAELANRREADGHVRDRRFIAEQKAEAQNQYHAAVTRAADLAGIQDAAAAWLRSMDGINRRTREADHRARELDESVAELDRLMPNIELKADGARISAESAEAACMDARRALAACEEQGSRAPIESQGVESAAATAPVATDTSTPVAPNYSTGRDVVRAARTLMNGNRDILLGLALRLADETGLEAGRLQLLLLELREKIAARALEDYALAFPDDHPFWSQFPSEAARDVVASLASLGFRFDGIGGWAEGRSPAMRDLALALSYCGYDPRSMRRPGGQAAVDALWEGTHVRGEEYLLALAPTLELNEVVTLLGGSANRLGEIWDIWGRLRPLLLRAP